MEEGKSGANGGSFGPPVLREDTGNRPRYWVIAPVESNPPELFDAVWKFDLAEGLISIGWHEIGDVSAMSREAIYEKVATTFPQKPPPAIGLVTNMLWNFYHEISPGDIIVARRGRKRLAGIGTVKRGGFYVWGKNPHLATAGYTHQNFLEIEWKDQPRDVIYPTVVFPMWTLAEWSEEQYQKLLADADAERREAVEGSEAAEPPTNPEDTLPFVLEKYLEEFIVSNFEGIFKGDLKLYVDDDGNVGQQYWTEIGPIDILAVDPTSNSFVVIELKRNRGSDTVVGQILRYMGWVKQNLCSEGQTVKGLVVCRVPDPKLTYALSMTSNIDVRYYTISFKLNP